MNLFDDNKDYSLNLLPKDGVVHYLGRLIPLQAADAYHHQFLENILLPSAKQHGMEIWHMNTNILTL